MFKFGVLLSMVATVFVLDGIRVELKHMNEKPVATVTAQAVKDTVEKAVPTFTLDSNGTHRIQEWVVKKGEIAK